MDRAGGHYQTHWSFESPVKAPLPKTNQKDWPLLPVDHFILNQLESKGIKPALTPTVIVGFGAVSLDLTGLPPSPKDADAFAADKSEDAHEKVVDRLLASEAYGNIGPHVAGLGPLRRHQEYEKTVTGTLGDTETG